MPKQKTDTELRKVLLRRMTIQAYAQYRAAQAQAREKLARLTRSQLLQLVGEKPMK